MGVFTSPDEARPRRAAIWKAPRTLTAAAAQVPLNDTKEIEKMRRRRNADKWQNDAWEYYDLIGEVKYAFNLVGAVISRIRLYAAATTGDNTIPSPAVDVTDLEPGVAQAAIDALKALESARGGIPGLLHDAAINLAVAGECYLVQTPERIGSGIPEQWRIHSVDELVIPPGSSKGAAFGIRPSRTSAATDIELLAPNAAAIRVWRMHPRFSDDADSSMRGLLDLCDELLLLNRAARATEKSRLNAGALYLPDGLSVSSAPDGETPDTIEDPLITAPYDDGGEDDFEEQLMDAMTTPITDESSASAVVPLLIRGPAELGEKIKFFKFERSFDQALVQRADKVLERILNGLDVPKDVVTGLANVKYSNAVQIEESLYKMHIEPLCLLICDALTIGYLRPVLKARGYSDDVVDRLTIWYDPSAITTKPDKASAATTGYEMYALSEEAWRNANGFSDTDAPTSLERAMRIMIDRGQISEPVTEALLKIWLPELMQQVRNDALATSPAPIPGDVNQVISGEGTEPASPGEAQGAPPSNLAEPTGNAPAATPPDAPPAPPAAA